MIRPRLSLLLRLALAGLWLLASVGKIADPMGFATLIHGYRLLPWALISLTAIYLPWLEFWIALFLLGNRVMRRVALQTGLALLLCFTVAIAFNLLRGLHMACGCFTTADGDPVTWWKVVENGCLAGLMLLALRQQRQTEVAPAAVKVS